MDKFIVHGGKRLEGEIKVSGAKNVSMKVILAGLLTDKPIYVQNIPLISSVVGTANIVRPLGVKVSIQQDHSILIHGNAVKSYTVPLELGGFYRTATMVMGPLLARFGKAVVPNPGGCRIGKRPIDRHIEGLCAMGAKITYKDGFFYGTSDGLHGVRYRFCNNTHTGTETLILAAVLAKGETVLENAAEEPEIDDLIGLLVTMGAKVKRIKKRTIVIHGVHKLIGAHYKIMHDRNEAVTFAISAITSGGDLIIEGAQRKHLVSFLSKLDQAGVHWEQISPMKIRFNFKGKLKPTTVTVKPHPGFMTDWQAPWSLLMTQANGISDVHETVYEDRFGYVAELKKMGAKIDFFNPKVDDPASFYNFNWKDRKKDNHHAIKIHGPTCLHNAVVEVSDLRAGATLLLATLIAQGESIIHGIDHIDRGYERIEDRLNKVGAHIERKQEV